MGDLNVAATPATNVALEPGVFRQKCIDIKRTKDAHEWAKASLAVLQPQLQTAESAPGAHASLQSQYDRIASWVPVADKAVRDVSKTVARSVVLHNPYESHPEVQAIRNHHRVDAAVKKARTVSSASRPGSAAKHRTSSRKDSGIRDVLDQQ